MAITRIGTYGQIKGLANSLPCRVATTASITLSGTQTIDAVALSAGDRVLVKNQGTESTNGIYIVAAGAWTRAIDMSLTDDVYQGVQVYVNSGTVNGGKVFVLTTANPITLDTTALTFTELVPGLSTMGVIFHGATSGTTRPSYTVVTWIGSVEPTNAINNDIWYSTV
jgi:phage-related tail fiber protein